MAPACSAAAAATVCKGERLALVIGNKAYPDSEVPLVGPVKAARRVGDALRAVGFDVEVGEDLTKAKTDADVSALLAKIKPGAAVFLFFSGFGVQAGGHTYLLPIDASIWSEADIAANSLNVDRVLTEVEERKAAVEVLVIDAARRNPFERRFRASGSAGLAAPSAIAGNLVALFSAPPGKVFDAADLSAEPFADDIAREISAPHATAQEAFRQVRELVARTSRAGQAPWGFSTLSYDLPLDIHDCYGSPDKLASPAQPQVAAVEPPKPAAAQPQAPSAPAPAPEAQTADGVPPPAGPKQAAKSDAPSPPPAPPPAAAGPKPAETAMVAPPPEPAPPPQPTTQPDDRARRFQIVLKDAALLEEVRERLFEQNLEPGPVGSDKMRDAIQAFEQGAGLPYMGQPTQGLLDALRASPSLSPWGAITVADDVKSWGMSWDKPSRATAVAEAKSRCGTRACSQELTFHGQGCGAFALSPKQWIVSHRDGGDAARQAALSDCGRAGVTCRVIGSVCADGSDKTD